MYNDKMLILTIAIFTSIAAIASESFFRGFVTSMLVFIAGMDILRR